MESQCNYLPLCKYVMLRKRGDSPNRAIRVIILYQKSTTSTSHSRIEKGKLRKPSIV